MTVGRASRCDAYADAIYKDMQGKGSDEAVQSAGQDNIMAFFRFQNAEYALRKAFGLLPKGGRH